MNKIIFILTFFFSINNSQAQTSIFPKIGIGQISLNSWPGAKIETPYILDKNKFLFFTYGIGLEQVIYKKIKIEYSTQLSSKISYYPIINIGWTGGLRREHPEEYKLWVNDLSVYYNIFHTFSFGGGVNHLQLRDFKYPGLVAINIDDFTKNRKHNYWGYHFGINYDWKSLGFLLQYSRTNISKEDLAKEYTYPAQKISLLTFSILYKFKLGKIQRKKKEGCPTF
jgi:hypothetical protein